MGTKEEVLAPFIQLEGQGFSGKTVQSAILVARLRGLGLDVVESQEPGGVASAVAIREEILKRRGEGTITPEEELARFFDSRERYYEEGVKPARRAGRWWVGTRGTPSTFVYQGKEGGIDIEKIWELDKKVVGDRWQPNLQFLLDTRPEEIWRRMENANDRQRHSFNEKDWEKIVNRQRYYREVAAENRHGHWVVIDGDGTAEEVHTEIWRNVVEKFATHPDHEHIFARLLEEAREVITAVTRGLLLPEAGTPVYSGD